MINAEAHRARRQIGKISDDPDHFVPALAPENKIMGRVMDDDVVAVICKSADAISDHQTEPPVAESQSPHQICNRGLENHNRQCDHSRIGISFHQLPDFRMRLDDRTGPSGMRLIKFGLVKRGLHRDLKEYVDLWSFGERYSLPKES